MKSAATAFADQRREEIFQRRPEPVLQTVTAPPPWQSIRSGEMPPLMLQFRFRTGEMISYSYHDIREVRIRDAGQVQVGIHGLCQLLITIEGRHLRDLGELIASGLTRWVQETDERAVEVPETSPCITSIAMEKISRK